MSAIDSFHIVKSFGELHNLNSRVSIWMLEEPFQKLKTFTCGAFQLFFFENLFETNEESKIQKDKKLTKKNIETLLNVIFTTNKKKEQIIQKYIEEKQIRLE